MASGPLCPPAPQSAASFSLSCLSSLFLFLFFPFGTSSISAEVSVSSPFRDHVYNTVAPFCWTSCLSYLARDRRWWERPPPRAWPLVPKGSLKAVSPSRGRPGPAPPISMAASSWASRPHPLPGRPAKRRTGTRYQIIGDPSAPTQARLGDLFYPLPLASFPVIKRGYFADH